MSHQPSKSNEEIANELFELTVNCKLVPTDILKALEAKDAEREKAVEALRDIASITPEDCERWGWYETVNKIVGRATEALIFPEVNNQK